MKQLSFLLIISTFLFLSCTDGKQNKATESQKIEFSAESNLKYDLLSSTEAQINYLSDVLSKNYLNQSAVDEWVFNKLSKGLLEKISPDKLKDIAFKANQLDLEKTDSYLSKFIFGKRQNIAYNALQGTAIKSILDDLEPKSYKDSIKYYLDQYEKAIEFDKNPMLYYDYYTKYSLYNEMNGDVLKSIFNLDKALTYLSEDDMKNRSVLYNNLSLKYKTLNYFEKAEYYIEKAISITKEEDLQLNTLNTLAAIKMRLNKLLESEKVYFKIIERSKVENDQSTLARAFTNLGNVSRRKKEFVKALDYYNMSDSICDELGLDIGKYINQVNRSEVYLDMENFKEAEESINKAEKLAEKFDVQSLNVELYKLLAEILAKNGKIAISDKYFRKYIEEKEKLSGDQTKNLITEWELTKEREKNQAANAGITLKLERQKNQIYFISLLFLVVLVSAIAFYLYQKKKVTERQATLEKEKQKMAYELELQSKTLLTESIKNLSINNTKETIYSDLKALIGELPKTHQTKFTKLLLELKSDTDTSFLDEFETRFTGVYEVFFEKLNKISPEISPTELKICALMRLNLSTKEIAMLTNRTVGTIDNTRSSIRKKLNLDDQVNLQQFLMEM